MSAILTMINSLSDEVIIVINEVLKVGAEGVERHSLFYFLLLLGLTTAANKCKQTANRDRKHYSAWESNGINRDKRTNKRESRKG